MLDFIYFTAIVNNDLLNIHTSVNFTYTLGSENGFGTITLQNFPAPGVNPVFAASFIVEDCKVTGVSLITKSNTVPTARWTLLQAERICLDEG